MITKQLNQYGTAAKDILKTMYKSDPLPRTIRWGNKGLYEKLEQDGYVSIINRRAQLTEAGYLEIKREIGND